ncbi:10400_t:CDS:2, partial [Dentiscutata heterogama]
SPTDAFSPFDSRPLLGCFDELPQSAHVFINVSTNDGLPHCGVVTFTFF